MARKLKLIPSTAEHANGIDFEMHFNPHTQRPDQRTHVDFKGTIKVLERLRFTFTPNGKLDFVPRDQVFPLIFPLLFIVSTQK